jgi:Mechanosensitive ion channel
LVSLTLVGIKTENIWGAAGVGAIVLGFALQSVLADLFSSLSIYLDRPFRVGDMVNINGSKGSIKRIGLKTTRIQSLMGDEIIVSNSQMLANQINNYRRMQKRRAEFSLTIDPKTSPKAMHRLQLSIGKWLQQSGADVVRNAFVGIEPGFYLCEVVYVLDDPDYELYVQLQERLNYYILAQAKKLKVILATNSLQNYTRRRTLS